MIAMGKGILLLGAAALGAVALGGDSTSKKAAPPKLPTPPNLPLPGGFPGGLPSMPSMPSIPPNAGGAFVMTNQQGILQVRPEAQTLALAGLETQGVIVPAAAPLGVPVAGAPVEFVQLTPGTGARQWAVSRAQQGKIVLIAADGTTAALAAGAPGIENVLARAPQGPFAVLLPPANAAPSQPQVPQVPLPHIPGMPANPQPGQTVPASLDTLPLPSGSAPPPYTPTPDNPPAPRIPVPIPSSPLPTAPMPSSPMPSTAALPPALASAANDAMLRGDVAAMRAIATELEKGGYVLAADELRRRANEQETANKAQAIARGATHTIRSGDIASSLALWYARDAGRWRELGATNPDLRLVTKTINGQAVPFGFLPWSVGQVLILPPGWDFTRGIAPVQYGAKSPVQQPQQSTEQTQYAVFTDSKGTYNVPIAQK
jgi:hypothetical protein